MGSGRVAAAKRRQTVIQRILADDPDTRLQQTGCSDGRRTNWAYQDCPILRQAGRRTRDTTRAEQPANRNGDSTVSVRRRTNHSARHLIVGDPQVRAASQRADAVTAQLRAVDINQANNDTAAEGIQSSDTEPPGLSDHSVPQWRFQTTVVSLGYMGSSRRRTGDWPTNSAMNRISEAKSRSNLGCFQTGHQRQTTRIILPLPMRMTCACSSSG